MPRFRHETGGGEGKRKKKLESNERGAELPPLEGEGASSTFP